MAGHGVGSAVPSLSRVQRQSCVFLLCITTPAVTDNEKKKEIVALFVLTQASASN